MAEMTARIVANNTRLGWYEHTATFPEAMALLHSEVSEILDAWRQWGFEDTTAPRVFLPGGQPGALPKPEGVGSEFADVYIRLMDDAWIFGRIDLEGVASPGRFALSDSFAANLNTLHNIISRASMADDVSWDNPDSTEVAWEFGSILTFLRQLAGHAGIDLYAETQRKMAYNETRPYRHGNKRL